MPPCCRVLAARSVLSGRWVGFYPRSFRGSRCRLPVHHLTTQTHGRLPSERGMYSIRPPFDRPPLAVYSGVLGYYKALPSLLARPRLPVLYPKSVPVVSLLGICQHRVQDRDRVSSPPAFRSHRIASRYIGY